MGSFVPAAAMSVLQLGAQSAQRNLQIAQQNQQTELARAAEEAQARGQIEQIQQSTQASERQRQDAIRRALARRGSARAARPTLFLPEWRQRRSARPRKLERPPNCG